MQRYKTEQPTKQGNYRASYLFRDLRGTSAGISYDSTVCRLKRKYCLEKWQQQPPSEAAEVYLFPWEDSRCRPSGAPSEPQQEPLTEPIRVLSNGSPLLTRFFTFILS